MRLDKTFYQLAYRGDTPHWNQPDPHPELVALEPGLLPGRALDVGCGTGSDALYLAERGWQVVGVDFVPQAIHTATARARAAGSAAQFVVADATQLRRSGVDGPFDLVVDVGCYHAIPDRLRDAYATEVAALTPTGADLFIAGVSHPPASWRLLRAHGVNPDELQHRFAPWFQLVDQTPMGTIGKAGSFTLYHLSRATASVPSRP
jgi:cyclopropane fatty-acyl-phospholipid synthase-like methyltransferase